MAQAELDAEGKKYSAWGEFLIPTGNEELDNRIGGGIPGPNIIMIEGEHGTGKSILAQQISYGAINNGFRVTYVTTESGVKELIMHMRRVGLDITDGFLKGLIKIIPVHMEGVKWAVGVSKKLLYVLGNFMNKTKDEYDVFVVDSFSVLALYSELNMILDFLTRLRTLVREGKLVIVTTHPSTLTEEIMTRMRAISDGYIELKFGEVGGRLIKIMKIIKLRGAHGAVDSTIAFDVDPGFGIKVIPLALAKT